MTVKSFIIGHLSWVENFLKVVTGSLLILSIATGTLRDQQLLAKISKLYPEVYTIVGVIGVYCAFQLIKGLKTGCWVRLVCWISFQCAAIFNLIYVYVNLSDVIESISGPNMQKLISVAIFMHIIIEIYCLITIMEICARIGDEMTQEVNNFDSDPPPYKLLNEDHPPLYEEVMQLNV